ncbi:LysM peptidoglycan-binding domain-containing protein [Sulfurimonas sp. HSL1-6]|uniref:lytic transglycosylase domain-containing protein n=1 Tax=Thiomicrolovo immobilis TaxID=3131935 RepID=UPI0031F8A4EB
MVIGRILAPIFLLPALLFGALFFDSDSNREAEIVRAFDLPPAFLNDPKLQKIISKKRTEYQRHGFFKSLNQAYLFIPMIKDILVHSDVPDEFLFLAMAESGFSIDAYSHKKASGVWQFMPETGRTFGLQINDYVDERRDLVKSTKAAITYLETLHARFNKWYLAAIAYNCGEGRLYRAIKKAGTDNIAVLLDEKKRYLPRESRNYIRKIVALTLLASDEDFMINQEYAYLLNRANAYSIAQVKVSRGERISRVAKLINMPAYKLTSLNPHLKYDFVPPKNTQYTIYIPYVKLNEFRQNYKPAPLETFYMLHHVEAGDNLSRIGKKYRVPYKMIKEFNRLHTNMLRIGQKLVIPLSKPLDLKNGKYTVKRGDSLEAIARIFETTVSSLKKLNNIKGSLIRVGDRLSIYD